jgi:hypothetical protein
VDLSSKEKTECRRFVPRKFKKLSTLDAHGFQIFSIFQNSHGIFLQKKIDGWVDGWEGDQGRREDL